MSTRANGSVFRVEREGVRGLDEFLRLERVALMDCEFTCWEDSLRTNWADPSRPPELIEIGLVEYDLQSDRAGCVFTSLVRPRLNSELSAYCKSVVGIKQEEVDQAHPLGEVLQRVEAWLSSLELSGAPICEWGAGDRLRIAREAERYGCSSPFDGAPQVDLERLYRSALGNDVSGKGDRDSVRALCGLAENRNRHRALDDALDLAQFCAHLRKAAL